jgi:hypothetical protein
MKSTYKDYDAFDIEPPFCLAYAAPTEAGKSTNIYNLLKVKWKDCFDNIMICCPSLKFDKNDYTGVVELFEGTDTKLVIVVDDFVVQVRAAIAEQEVMKQKNKDDPENNPLTSTLIIFDDCIGTNIIKSNRTDNCVDSIATKGRHIELSCIITTQVLSELSYAVRRNAKGLFVFSPMNYTDFERVLDEYVPKEFQKELQVRAKEIFKEDFAFILIDGSRKRRNDFRMRIRKGFRDLVFPLGEQAIVPGETYFQKAKKTRKKNKD